MISADSNNILNEGITIQNNFYKKINFEKFGLMNFIYPDLSNNDRYILPYEKIVSEDVKSFKDIADKYNVDFVFIINNFYFKKNNSYKLSVYIKSKNIILNIYNSTDNNSKKNYIDIFKIYENWWKNFNIIDNLILNRSFCSIRNDNIFELYFIKSKIESLSQIKSILLENIKLGKNFYLIDFYGSLTNFNIKLSKLDINYKIMDNNECVISVKN